MHTRSLLDRIERTGNRLPDPIALFAGGTLLVMLLSQLAVTSGWSVSRTVSANGQQSSETVTAVSLLDSDGLWWLLSNLVDNFVSFPPLGLVLVGMLGIGVAERSGLIPDLLQRLLGMTPAALLTPATAFIGILSSLALDAGYVVLPPLAAALYLAAGRSPVTGIAVATAGVTAGFSANLFITALDPLLAGFSSAGAQFIDRDYQVAVTANWWFMIASTGLLTVTAWVTTHWVVEPRAAPTAPASPTEQPLGRTTGHAQALRVAGLTLLLSLAAVLALVWLPGAPLSGQGARFPRWMEVVVPLMLLLFLLPGLAYGVRAGTIRSSHHAAAMMGDTLKALGPYIVLAFFAAQFIACFNHSRLGEMLAITGGDALAATGLAPVALVIGFVLVVMAGNLLIGSASAKYAFFAPVFVPLFMQVGISPELTQAAYRVGDSVSNGITPLNPYLIIILVVLRRYQPQAGIGTLVALMLPYTISFFIVWSLLLGVWVFNGWELGPGGPVTYALPD